MATLELAMSLIAALAIALVGVFGISVLVQQLTLTEQCGQLARAVARGDRVVAEQVRARMDATVEVARQDRFVVVTATGSSQPWGMMPAVELHAVRRSLAEDTDAPR